MTILKKTVDLTPGQSKVASFVFTPAEVRAYQVLVNGLTGSFIAIGVPTFYWLLPTGHVLGMWNDAELAYDGWTDTRAEVTGVGTQSWSPYLELTITPTEVSAIRWWASSPVSPKKVQVDLYYNGAWHHIYEGSAVIMWDNGIAIPDGTQVVSRARIRFYNPSYSMTMKFRVNEFQFFGYAEAPPPPPPPPPTTKLFGYVNNAYTGAPIVGAVGTVYQDYDTHTDSYNFTTDAQGYYLIDNILFEVDVTMMVIYADGYQTYTNESIPISKGDNQLNVQMLPL